MSVPDFFNLAAGVFHAFPEDIVELRRLCDLTDRLRDANGEDDPGVQDGERKVNALKALFTRRIAWACHSRDDRFGMRRKESGQHATRPIDGAPMATDALMMHDTGQIIDCMSDRDVTWIVRDGDTQPLGEWLAPLAEDTGVDIPGPGLPPPPPPPPASNELLLRVEQLERDVREQKRTNDELVARVVFLEQQEAKTPPPFDLPALEAVGKVPWLGEVRLPVRKK